MLETSEVPTLRTDDLSARSTHDELRPVSSRTWLRESETAISQTGDATNFLFNSCAAELYQSSGINGWWMPLRSARVQVRQLQRSPFRMPGMRGSDENHHPLDIMLSHLRLSGHSLMEKF